MNEQAPLAPGAPDPALGEIGLDNFAPYLMNRIMGRYNASPARPRWRRWA
jgi:hypothetical protein